MVLLTEGFEHLGDATLFLLHVGVDIEVEGCGDVGVPQEDTYRFIIAVAFDATGGE